MSTPTQELDNPFRDIFEDMESSKRSSDQPSSMDNSQPGSAGGARPRTKKTVGFSYAGDVVDTQDRPKSFISANSPSPLPPQPHTPTGPIPQISLGNSPSHSRVGSGDNLLQAHRAHLPIVSPEITNELRAALTIPVPRPRPAMRRGDSALSVNADPSNTAGTDTPQTIEAREAYRRGKKLEHKERIRSAPTSRRSSPTRDFSGDSAGRDIPLQDFATFSDSEEDDVDQLLSTKTKTKPASHHLEAAKLVETHTKAHQLQPQHVGSRSGVTTPIEEQYDMADYVPKPETYRGGILGALLKLYNQPPGAGSHSRSNSISMPRAHIRGSSFGGASSVGSTPQHSPPTSGTSTPIPGGKSGRHWYSPRHENASSSSLARLISSSSVAAYPAVSGLGEEVAERLRQQQKDKKRPGMGKRTGSSGALSGLRRQEEIRIRIHIAETISRQKYLLLLCRALMQYGAPTHRLEEYMRMSSRVLEIEAQYLYIPGSMIISFDDESTHTTEVKLVRVNQGLDLGKLRDTHEVYKEVVHDRIGVEEAKKRLEEVMAKHVKHSKWVLIPVYGFASAYVGPFAFGARPIDLPVAFLLGCILGVLQLFVAPQSDLYANVFEISASVITSFLARAFGSIKYSDGTHIFCFSALAQSAIALILPGYLVLCASLELQSRSMVAGSVRMVYAIIYSLFLGFGITIGTVLYGMMDKHAVSKTTCDSSISHYYFFFSVPVFSMCLIIINQAKWKQAPVMMIIAFAGYIVNYFSSQRFAGNAQVSSTLGALAIGVMANLYSRLGQRVENFFLDVWEDRLRPICKGAIKRFRKTKSRVVKLEEGTAVSGGGDTESLFVRHTRRVGYGLAAAAMLPAIFVQVPSGLAVSGSLVAGIASADQITGNSTNGTQTVNTTTLETGAAGLNSIAFNVGYSVIQVAIGITVGLFLSSVIVYPFGKRRSGLFSF